MATTKVGIYRKYHGAIPKDSSGRPLPKSQWPKRRPHSWAVRWFGSDGKRYSQSFRTRKEAQRFAEDKQPEVDDSKGDPPEDITLGKFLREHEKTMRSQVALETLADQIRALKMLASHVGKNVLLKEIQPRHAEVFLAWRLSTGRRPATVNKDIRTLRRVFNLAISPRGYLSPGRNPFAGIRQRKVSSRTLRYVTPEEFQRVLTRAGNSWWRALLLVAYTTGARLNEIIHLTWSDADFDTGRLRVARKDATELLVAWEPKDHEERLLPAPPSVMQELADLQMMAAEGCPYVFVTSERWAWIQAARRARRWSEGRSLVNNLNRRLATLRKRSGVEKFTFHDLRRSCITNWARALPAHVVQKLAGHSDLKTTQKYYLAVREADLEAAARAQASLLDSAPTDPLLTHSGQFSEFSAVEKEKASRLGDWPS
jgi:integrase